MNRRKFLRSLLGLPIAASAVALTPNTATAATFPIPGRMYPGGERGRELFIETFIGKVIPNDTFLRAISERKQRAARVNEFLNS